MTTGLKLRIGQGRADLTLACGHVTRLLGYSVLPIPRPGTELECPACRVLETELAAQFTLPPLGPVSCTTVMVPVAAFPLTPALDETT